jgi:hypothetical protein
MADQFTGLKLAELTLIGAADPSYSFIATFDSASHGEEERGSQGAARAPE